MQDLKKWIDSGAPWVWLNAGAVAVSLVMVFGLLLLIAVRGLGHFWPADIHEFRYNGPDGSRVVLGAITGRERVSRQRVLESGLALPPSEAEEVERVLVNEELLIALQLVQAVFGADFQQQAIDSRGEGLGIEGVDPPQTGPVAAQPRFVDKGLVSRGINI